MFTIGKNWKHTCVLCALTASCGRRAVLAPAAPPPPPKSRARYLACCIMRVVVLLMVVLCTAACFWHSTLRVLVLHAGSGMCVDVWV